MRILLFAFVILFGCTCRTWAQEPKAESDTPFANTFQNDKKPSASSDQEPKNFLTFKIQSAQNTFISASGQNQDKPPLPTVEAEFKLALKEKDAEKNEISDAADDEKPPAGGKERFHWKPALIQSGVFLGFQHGFRMMQNKTRRELGGPFFRDWAKSVKGLRGWNDSDSVFTNYVAHPLQGGLTGRVFINNSDRANRQEFGKSPKYWESRLKAMAWSAVWSAQFELGPISEASLGNVGQHQRRGRDTMGWTDLVVTPVLGTGVVILEDVLDKFVLKNWLEKKVTSKFKIRALRIVFNPTTSVSNMLRLKPPSWREHRKL